MCKWLQRAGRLYLVASNETEPPGKRLQEEGVFKGLKASAFRQLERSLFYLYECPESRKLLHPTGREA